MRHKVEVFLAILVSAVIFNFIFKIDMRSISVDSLIEESEVNENDVSNKKKVIYLTFDDGPSYKVTGKILDILEEKEVKATFFVIGNQIEDKEDVLKRMNEEGHSIGLHTFTHKYKCIYCHEDCFIREMIE